MNNLLILTEGGGDIGLGHIIRCSALYNYLKENGWLSRMFVQWDGKEFSFDGCEEVSWRDSINTFVTLAKDFDIVLVDSYLTPIDIFLELKRHFKKLVVIDDYGRLKNYNADLVINPNIYGEEAIKYEGPYIGGDKYVILRDAFRAEKRKNCISNSVNKILITLGGSEIKSLLPQLAGLFKNMAFECYFLCGNQQNKNKLMTRFSDQENFYFFDLVDQKQMIELMIGTDIAISACGQTLHELAYLGTPTIGIKIGEDQAFNQISYWKTGFLTTLINCDDENLLEILKIEIESVAPITKRELLHKIGTRLIDGNGVKRIEKGLLNA